jgi:DNA-binding winged helix-turn-helix (wHTH) protein/Tol biopolymer transport system component
VDAPSSVPLLRFGQFELDLRARALRKDGRSTGLPAQSVIILAMVLERPGQAVLRDEIRTRLWPNNTIVEFDHSINAAIRRLRVALGDSADAPRYIETLARRGYRWIGPPVSREAAPAAEDIGEAASDAPAVQQEPDARHRGRAGNAKFVVGGAVLGIVALFLWISSRTPPASPSGEWKLRQLTQNSGENLVTSGAISPDGTFLAYVDTRGLHLRVVGSDDEQLVTGPETPDKDRVTWEVPWEPWFPDGKHFLLNAHPASETEPAWSSRTTDVWVASVAGVALRKIRDHAFAWSTSADGKWISFGANAGTRGDTELWLMGPNGEQARRLEAVKEDALICCLHFHPGSERISYIVEGSAGGGTLLARDLEGGHAVVLLRSAETKVLFQYAWLPDDGVIYPDMCVFVRPDVACDLWLIHIDTRSGGRISAPLRLTNLFGASLNDLSVTADGRRIAFIQSVQQNTAFLADLAAGDTTVRNARHFTLDANDSSVVEWLPDGSAAIVATNRGDSYDLYRQSLTSEARQPVVTRARDGLLAGASSTPDEKWLILEVYPGPLVWGPAKRSQIWRVHTSGGSPEMLFTVAPGSEVSCPRSASSVCVLAEPTEDRKQVIVSALDPGAAQRKAEILRFELVTDPYDPASATAVISPDGRYLATRGGSAGLIRILSLSGGPARDLRVKELANLGAVQWTADGTGLIVTNTTDREVVLLHVNMDGNSQLLWTCESRAPCQGSPSPDGRHLAVTEGRATSNVWQLEKH